jgi:hypothetical protein
MKKIVTLLLCLMLEPALAVPAAAEEEFEGIMEVLPVNTFADKIEIDGKMEQGEWGDPVYTTTPEQVLKHENYGWAYREFNKMPVNQRVEFYVTNDSESIYVACKLIGAAYDAGAIITGGHTIRGAEPIYGLAVSGFVHPQKVLTNSNAKPGDVLILTKPLGVGIITTGAKADMVEGEVMDRIYAQMATLNKAARDIMVQYDVHSCTDVTGFGLMGHSYEMAQGSNCTLHIQVDKVPYHAEALELAAMGLIPAGAYRNREYAQAGVAVRGNVSLAMEDILYDPQTSGGLLFAIPEAEAEACLSRLKQVIPNAAIIGYVTEKEDSYIILE